MSLAMLSPVSTDTDWKVRFASSLGGATMLCALREIGGTPVLSMSKYAAIGNCARHDDNDFVRGTHALWSPCLDKDFDIGKAKSLGESALALLARFVCLEYEDRMAEVEWECDAATRIHVPLLLAVRQLKCAETDARVSSWRKSQSVTLRKAAAEYFRAAKSMGRRTSSKNETGAEE